MSRKMILWHLRYIIGHQLSSKKLNIRRILRIFLDGCFGQNKNINMLGVLIRLRQMIYDFPVRGNSFSLQTRVFGNIDKDLTTA
ncbi:hypothetical protein PoB_001219600 [Plakobranchus ocellatus]|uniref:Uncharacterized protein n=1 Tax=Plakobranchus ocellatus TaxID=259542 RepID=A0AAV3YTJ5_9GAST|nr:hypothetical protein PoB_001219600 [Plakobranchus ocellatus]